MDKAMFTKKGDNAWCAGCGNFPILNTLKKVFAELNLNPSEIVIVSGIGQAAKTPQYINANMFNGLHGRALPPATAIKATNQHLTVIAESGDGDTYGEGGNHFLHCIRRNPDITNIVHNNMVYGLTKGQAAPTAERGLKTPVQVNGVYLEPFNPLAVAISLNASFVARANAADLVQTKDIFQKAIEHKGYALVDVFQPCVVYNKVNTYQWFKENCYYLDEHHDPYNRQEAFKRATEEDKLPLGIFYINTNNPTFEENLKLDKEPFYTKKFDRKELAKLIASRR